MEIVSHWFKACQISCRYSVDNRWKRQNERKNGFRSTNTNNFNTVRLCLSDYSSARRFFLSNRRHLLNYSDWINVFQAFHRSFHMVISHTEWIWQTFLLRNNHNVSCILAFAISHTKTKRPPKSAVQWVLILNVCVGRRQMFQQQKKRTYRFRHAIAVIILLPGNFWHFYLIKFKMYVHIFRYLKFFDLTCN